MQHCWKAAEAHRQCQKTVKETHTDECQCESDLAIVVHWSTTGHCTQAREEEPVDHTNEVGNQERAQNQWQQIKGADQTVATARLIVHSCVTQTNGHLPDLKIELVERGFEEEAITGGIIALKLLSKDHKTKRVEELECTTEEERKVAVKLLKKAFKQMSLHDRFKEKP